MRRENKWSGKPMLVNFQVPNINNLTEAKKRNIQSRVEDYRKVYTDIKDSQTFRITIRLFVFALIGGIIANLFVSSLFLYLTKQDVPNLISWIVWVAPILLMVIIIYASKDYLREIKSEKSLKERIGVLEEELQTLGVKVTKKHLQEKNGKYRL